MRSPRRHRPPSAALLRSLRRHLAAATWFESCPGGSEHRHRRTSRLLCSGGGPWGGLALPPHRCAGSVRLSVRRSLGDAEDSRHDSRVRLGRN